MSQRISSLTRILGIAGWKVAEDFFEWKSGPEEGVFVRVDLRMNPRPSARAARLILRLERRWTARCPKCGKLCHREHGSAGEARRWKDLSWSGFDVYLEYEAIRVKCEACHSTPVEQLPFAEAYQHETVRYQQRVTVEAASMPILHVAELHGLSWGTVRRIEGEAIGRWERTRVAKVLRWVGIDEKFLGRRGRRQHGESFVTIVSDLETGEPVWIGYGRSEATVKQWLDTLTKEQKQQVELVAMDMHLPFYNAIAQDPDLEHVSITHDPFHVMKRANEAVDELRREVFFRAEGEMRAVGTGARWLFLRAWEKCSRKDHRRLTELLSFNGQLANAYQVKEELRAVLSAPDRAAMETGFLHILRRTQRRSNQPLRKLHESLVNHRNEILMLGEFNHPPVGRIEALNNNWETLVRRARGYRDHEYLLRKLRFMTANPIRTGSGLQRFLALEADQSATRVAA